MKGNNSSEIDFKRTKLKIIKAHNFSENQRKQYFYTALPFFLTKSTCFPFLCAYTHSRLVNIQEKSVHPSLFDTYTYIYQTMLYQLCSFTTSKQTRLQTQIYTNPNISQMTKRNIHFFLEIFSSHTLNFEICCHRSAEIRDYNQQLRWLNNGCVFKLLAPQTIAFTLCALFFYRCVYFHFRFHFRELLLLFCVNVLIVSWLLKVFFYRFLVIFKLKLILHFLYFSYYCAVCSQ